MPTVKEVIVHCQNKIKKNPGSEKLLHYLKRLGRIRITIDDLRETGVGKTVNQLSRLEGEVGQYAGRIVEEWKAMVETETDDNEHSESESESESEIENELEIDINHRTESSPEQEVKDNHHDNDNNNNNNNSPIGQHDDDDDDEGGELNLIGTSTNIKVEVKEEQEDDEEEPIDQLELSEKQNHVGDENEDFFDHSLVINNNNLPTTFKESVDYHKQRDKQREKEKHQQQHENITHSPINNNPLEDKKSTATTTTTTSHHQHRDKDRDNNRNRDSKKSKSHRKEKEEDKIKSKKSVSEDKIKIENIVEHKEQDREKHSTRIEHKQYKSESSGSSSSKDRSHHQNEKGKGDKEQSSKDYRHHRHDRDRDDSKKSSKSTLKDEEHSSSKRDRKRDTDYRKEVKLEKDDDEKLNTKYNINASSSTSTSTKHDKQREKYKSTEKQDKSTNKHGGSSSSTINEHVKIKEEKHESNKDSTSKRKKADHSPEDINKGEKSVKKQKVMSKLENQEIDSTSGLNFADVLGCLDSKTSLKTTKKIVSSSSNGGCGGVGSSSTSKSKKTGGESSSSSILPPPKSKVSVIKTEPKNINCTTSSSNNNNNSNGIVNESYAPPVLSIQPPKPSSLAFQPLDLFPEEKSSNRTKWEDSLLSIQENHNDYDTLSSMITSRKDRTKVYSGKNSGYVGEIPSLFNMCIRVIQENLDSLGFTGGVPFDILKPALERASVKQLSQIEFYNPYLLESTDELWKHHCHRECRGQKPQEMENWRDLYYRFQDECQQRLQKLSTKVKKNVELAQPVRKTKLAYVEPSARGPKFNKSKAATIKNGMKSLKHREEMKSAMKSDGSSSSGSKNSGSTNKMNYKEEEAAIVIASDSRAGSAPAPSVHRENFSSGLKKPRKAPLMAKCLKTMKSVFRR